MDTDALGVVREALAHQDWPAALQAANAADAAVGGAPMDEAELTDARATALWWLGRLEECIEARECAYRLYEELDSHRAAGMCAVWLWEHHSMRARPSIAGAWLRRARRLLEHDAHCVEHGALLLREAESDHGNGDVGAALAKARTGLQLGRKLRSADLEAEALQTLGRILIDEGQVAEGMAHLDEAMLFAVEGRLSPYSTGKVYCSLISACEQLGDLDRAAEWTDATLRWSERHPFAVFPGICRVHRAVVLKSKGDLSAAEREATQACEELLGSHLGNSAAAFAQVGDIRRRVGDLDGAEEAFARARELCGRPCGELALLRLAQGRVTSAMEIVSECLQHTSPNSMARAELLPVLIHIAIAANDLDAADHALEELEAISDRFGTRMLEATTLSTRGRLQLAAGDPSSARETLRDALNCWRALDIPYEEATAETLLGEALHQTGDERAATGAFKAAAQLFEQMGARLDARRVAHSNRSVHPAGLTDREVEVLRLIAAGRSNADIANELYLSVKTVSRHVSNIFTKIGVASRSAATAYAFEHELTGPRH